MSPSRSLDELVKGDTLGIKVTQEGQLEIFVNNQSEGFAVTGIPLNQTIWGVVDMYGTCQQISIVECQEEETTVAAIQEIDDPVHFFYNDRLLSSKLK
jgi:hypothetical protein